MSARPPQRADADRSAAAYRMCLHRERRRKGLRCITVELRDSEIEALIRRGYLPEAERDDRRAIRRALYAYFDRALL